jgi:pimeloyl-ACP methyl ester carboxylesterase/class 3 adenylate cyclase
LEEPTWVRWVERLASFARLVRFDKRGTGMSDRPPGIPTPDERMEDARAVMDAAGLTAAHVLGWSEGGPLAILLAVTHPDRVQSLILYGTQATFRRRDDYPFGDEESEEESEEWYAELETGWGTVDHVLVTHPDADPRFVQRRALYMQSAASPTAAIALAKSNALIDTRPLLPSIHVPALVLSRRDDPVGPGPTGRYLAERIPGARFVELAGDEHLPWLGDPEALCTEIEHFVTGVRPQALEPGVVRAILLCDLEGSTTTARTLGDERWADLLAAYGDTAERAVETHGGRLVDRTGDGLMAVFEGPVNAVRQPSDPSDSGRARPACARRGAHGRGCRAKRRFARHRRPPRSTRDGQGDRRRDTRIRDSQGHRRRLRPRFQDRGQHELKGIEGRRRLYAVAPD